MKRARSNSPSQEEESAPTNKKSRSTIMKPGSHVLSDLITLFVRTKEHGELTRHFEDLTDGLTYIDHLVFGNPVVEECILEYSLPIRRRRISSKDDWLKFEAASTEKQEIDDSVVYETNVLDMDEPCNGIIVKYHTGKELLKYTSLISTQGILSFACRRHPEMKASDIPPSDESDTEN